MPDAQYLYACDKKWWEVHIEAVKKVFKGDLYTQYRKPDELSFAQEHGITALEGMDGQGLGKDKLHFNSNSGAQAINLAFFKGATRIILLGYDMQNTGGKSHWFGDHPKELHNGQYLTFVDRFTRLAQDLKAEGVDVVNCTRETALTQFRRAELSEVL